MIPPLYLILPLLIFIVFHLIAFLIHVAIPYWQLRKYTEPNYREQMMVTPFDAKEFFAERYQKPIANLIVTLFLTWSALLALAAGAGIPVLFLVGVIVFFHLTCAAADTSIFLAFAINEVEKGKQVSYVLILKAYCLSIIRIVILAITAIFISSFCGGFILVIALIYFVGEGCYLKDKNPFSKMIEAYKQPME